MNFHELHPASHPEGHPEPVSLWVPLSVTAEAQAPTERQKQVPLEPRPYQSEAVAACLRWYHEGRRRMVISLPTAAGKTVLAGLLLSSFLGPGEHALILVPFLDLVQQTRDELVRFFFPDQQVGMIQGEHDELGRRITIASKDTLARPHRLARYLAHVPGGRVACLLADEAHRMITEGAQQIIEATCSPSTLLVGLTATPFRADRRSLRRVFSDGMVYSKSIWELIRDNYLVDIEAYDIPTSLDLSSMKGSVEKISLEQLRSSNIYEETWRAWQEIAYGKRTITYGRSTRDARCWHDLFIAHQVPSATVFDTTSPRQRQQLYQQFRAGHLLHLSNYLVLSTGLNIKEVECIILGDTSSNLGLFIQKIGRGLRPAEGKEKLIVLNPTDKHHLLTSFHELFGTLVDRPVSSVRQALQQGRQEAPVSSSSSVWRSLPDRFRVDPSLKQKSIAGKEGIQRSSVFLSEDWQADPESGGQVLCWQGYTFCVEPVLGTGHPHGYLATIHYPSGRSKALCPLTDQMSAQVACEEKRAALREELARRTGSSAALSAPILDWQFRLLLTRKVPLYLGYGHLARSPDELARVREGMTMGHYSQIESHLRRWGAAYSREGGGIAYQKGRGVFTFPARHASQNRLRGR